MEELLSNFQLMQLYGSYLLDCGYNTYDEIMHMTVNQMRERFDDVTKGGS